jgi:hypothetical protein
MKKNSSKEKKRKSEYFQKKNTHCFPGGKIFFSKFFKKKTIFIDLKRKGFYL